MSDRYEETGTCPDIDGEPVFVGHKRDMVIVKTLTTVAGHGFICLGPDQRDAFMQLYAAAEHRAEAWAAANRGGDQDA